MKTPETPINESQRLDALESYAIMDTPQEPRFDALTALAANILNVPIALISLVDADRQWFKSHYGLVATQTPRDISFCGHVVATETSLFVNDSHDDPRFRDNPLVTGNPHVRFYAGVPLKTPDGFVLGTFCAIDHVPRDLTPSQITALTALANQVIEVLELQRRHTRVQHMLRDHIAAQGAEMAELKAHRQFFDLTLGLMATVDETLHFSHLNPAWQDVLGWSAQELCAQPFSYFVHPEDLQITMEEARKLGGADAKTINFENRFLHKSGAWVNLSWVAASRDGRMYCTALDISQYKQATAQLSTSEARLRAIIDTASDAIITVDEYGCIERVNPAVECVFGFSSFESVGKLASILLPQINWSNSEAGGPAGAALTGFHRDVLCIRKGGIEFPGELAISELFLEGKRMFTVIVRDVTARKQAERDLAQLRSSLDRTKDAIFIFDPTTLRYLYASQGAVKHLGYSVTELLGMTPVDLKPLFSEESYRRILSPLIAGEVAEVTFETIHRAKDGADIPVEIVLQYLKPENEAPRFINVVRDISERKREEKIKSQFVSIVSHELRTPLTSVRGALGLVAKGVTGELPAQAKEYVDIALSNTERLVRLINDILDIEKIQAGSMEYHTNLFDLAAVLRTAVIANSPLAAAQGVSLTLAATDPGVEVLIDEDHLIQVLTNLISNAVKYSPPEGIVEVATERVGQHVRVNVIDHGPGIPEAFRSRIFQRFAQADSSDTRKKGGTGLGLSIAKALVEGMKGTIGFCETPGGGTTLFFELPCLEKMRPASEAVDARRILVCENDLDLSHQICEVLAKTGAITHVAPTLDRARNLLLAERYDVVAIDLMFTDGDAAQFLSDIRSNPVNADAGVIVICGTSAGQLPRMLGVAALTVADILEKPIDEARLLGSVRRLLGDGAFVRRVLHVEDDRDIRRVVDALLPAEWQVVGADTLAEARQRLSTQNFDLVLLDMTLPDGSGETLIDAVGSAHVVIFSASDIASTVGGRVSRALVKSRNTEFQLRDAVVGLMATRASRETSR